MVLVGFLEILSLMLGLSLFYKEVITLKFKNFVPAVFILLYFPLFCITPLLYHLITGGAMTINPGYDGLVFSEPKIYIVYHIYNITFLVCFLFLSNYLNKINSVIKVSNDKISFIQNLLLFLFLFFGVYLYVYSTGLSLGELLIADRFSWFLNPNYSSFASVVSSYFISLSPLLLYLYIKNKNHFFLVFTIILLVSYGILSKDRKWLIFLISGTLGAIYFLNGFKIILKTKIIFWTSIFGFFLVFWQIFRDVLLTELITGRGDFLFYAKEMGKKLALKGDFPYYYFSSITAIKMNMIDGFGIPFGIIRRQLFFFFPVDYSLGLKIKDISAIFSDALNAGDSIRSGNMPPGFIGLFVLSFNWWLGQFFYVLIPFFLYYVNKIVRKNTKILQPVIFSNCFSFFILFLRGDDSSATYFFIFNLIIFILLKPFYFKKNYLTK